MNKVAIVKGLAIKVEGRLIDQVINIMAQDKGWDTKPVEHTADMSFPRYILFYTGYTHVWYVQDKADIKHAVSFVAVPECITFNQLEHMIPDIAQPVMLNDVAVEFCEDAGIKVPCQVIDNDTLVAIVMRQFGVDLNELLGSANEN